MVAFEGVSCPHCDSDPVNLDEARTDVRLKNLGYLHRDITLRCSNGHSWTHGVPSGSPETSDVWQCGACDSYYVPRDVALGNDGSLQVVVKCMDCYHKPDRPLRFDVPTTDTGNNEWRVLLGHPLVCGDTNEAVEHNAKLIQ